MPMDIEEQIKLYLEDNDLLYQEWYKKQLQFDTGIDHGEACGLKEWKKECGSWLELHKAALKERICPHRKKIKAKGTAIGAILGLIELIEDMAGVASVVATSTILLIQGIDKLCEDYES